MKKTLCYNLGRSLKIVFDSELSKNDNINNGINELRQQLKELSEMSDDELREISKKQYYKYLVESDEQ